MGKSGASQRLCTALEPVVGRFLTIGIEKTRIFRQ